MLKVHLKFKSSLPAQTIASDTLFDAVVWGYRHLYGKKEADKLVESFQHKPPFILSSAFPYLEAKNNKLYFYPMPRLLFHFSGDREYVSRFNKIEFVPEEIFWAMCRGEFNSDEIELRKSKFGRKELPCLEFGEKYFLFDRFLVPDWLDGRFELFKRVERPGNYVNRLTLATDESLYFRDEIFLSDKAGVFFFVRGDQEVLKRFNSCLRFLEDRGIGGEISTGGGNFKLLEIEEVEEFEAPEKAFVTLSLYSPTKEELSTFSSEACWYELRVRQGKIEAAFLKLRNPWKKKLLMFCEGSVFPATGKEYYGSCPVVKKRPLRIVEYGIAFAVDFRGVDLA